MNRENAGERERLLRQLGAREVRIGILERRIADWDSDSESAALEWKRLTRHRKDLADWLIDLATDERGEILKSTIDAKLGGESFVPCSFTATSGGRRYRFELISTE